MLRPLRVARFTTHLAAVASPCHRLSDFPPAHVTTYKLVLIISESYQLRIYCFEMCSNKFPSVLTWKLNQETRSENMGSC